MRDIVLEKYEASAEEVDLTYNHMVVNDNVFQDGLLRDVARVPARKFCVLCQAKIWTL